MKYIKYITILLIAVSVIFLILFMIAPATLENMGMVGPFLSWAYILTGVAIVFSVGLPFIDMLQNPKKLKKFGINVGLIVVVLFISFLIASPSMPDGAIKPSTGEDVRMMFTEAPWKLTDAGLIMMYILAFAAFAAIVVGGIVNAVRNR